MLPFFTSELNTDLLGSIVRPLTDAPCSSLGGIPVGGRTICVPGGEL